MGAAEDTSRLACCHVYQELHWGRGVGAAEVRRRLGCLGDKDLRIAPREAGPRCLLEVNRRALGYPQGAGGKTTCGLREV